MADQSSYEPMDIDLSAHSNHAMDISYNSSSSANDIDAYLDADEDDDRYIGTPAESTTPIYSPPESARDKTARIYNLQKINIRDVIINKDYTVSMRKSRKSCLAINPEIKIICFVAVLLISVLTYNILNVECSGDFNPDELMKNLSTKLFGQAQAIQTLVEGLEVTEKSKIIFIYGGTGVGKTFTASLILEHIGYYSNVYHYVMPSFMDNFSSDCMIGLNVCKHSTIIVDDLSVKDVNVRSHIEDVITKSQNLNKNITIILIYNCDSIDSIERQCDETFPDKILQIFKNIDAFKMLVKFEPLKQEHLKQCIENELGNRKLNSIEYQKLLKNFDVSLDGCKGVHSRMKMLEIL